MSDTRITVAFGEETKAMLAGCAVRLDKSRTEALRMAIALLDATLDAKARGHRVGALDVDPGLEVDAFHEFILI